MDFDADIMNLTNLEMSFDTENGSAPDMNVDVVTKIEHIQNSKEPRFCFEVEEEKLQGLIENQGNSNTEKYPLVI